jgi:hypothetical protein
MWPGIAGLVLAALALSFCAYLWLELQKKLSEGDISSALQRSSEELNKTSEKSFRALEAEWVDMYSKFMRLAGRIDKTKGIDAPKEVSPPHEAALPLRRSDLIRRSNGRKNHVEDVLAQ